MITSATSPAATVEEIQPQGVPQPPLTEDDDDEETEEDLIDELGDLQADSIHDDWMANVKQAFQLGQRLDARR